MNPSANRVAVPALTSIVSAIMLSPFTHCFTLHVRFENLSNLQEFRMMGLPFTVNVFWLISFKATSFVPGSTALASTVRVMTSSSSSVVVVRLHFASIVFGVYSVSAMRAALDEASPYGRRARRRKVAKWILFGVPRVRVTELLFRAFRTRSRPYARSVRERLFKRKHRWRLCKRKKLWRVSERVVALLLRKWHDRHDIRSERGYRWTLDLFLRAKTNIPATVLGGITVRVVTLIGAELWVLFQVYACRQDFCPGNRSFPLGLLRLSCSSSPV